MENTILRATYRGNGKQYVRFLYDGQEGARLAIQDLLYSELY